MLKAQNKNLKKVRGYFKENNIHIPFVDRMTHGHRISLRTPDDDYAEEFVQKLFKATGVMCKKRVRSGCGDAAGNWDIIVPFDEEE